MKRLWFLLPVAWAVASAQPTCDLNSIRGTYAVSYYGTMTILQPGAPPTTATGGIVGVVSIGYDGTLSGYAAVSGLGPVADYEVLGTVRFTSNCVGQITQKGRAKGTTEWTLTETDRFIFDLETNTFTAIIWDMGPGVCQRSREPCDASRLSLTRRSGRIPPAAFFAPAAVASAISITSNYSRVAAGI